jgi:hypothetical protein
MEKLLKYDDKPGFNEHELEELYTLLHHESHELMMAMANGEGYEAIRLEAADVANYAHMIVLFCDKVIDG